MIETQTKYYIQYFQTKTEAEVASEKEWLEAEKVWVVHKGGFSGGRMLKSMSANVESDTTRKVKLDHGGEIMNIDENCVEKVCCFIKPGFNIAFPHVAGVRMAFT